MSTVAEHDPGRLRDFAQMVAGSAQQAMNCALASARGEHAEQRRACSFDRGVAEQLPDAGREDVNECASQQTDRRCGARADEYSVRVQPNSERMSGASGPNT